MPVLMRGLAYGGLWACLWAIVEAVTAGSLLALPGVLAMTIPTCMAGGILGILLPTSWTREQSRGATVAAVLGAALVWAAAYGANHFQLTHSFDLLEEVAAVFATGLLVAALAAWALGRLLVAWFPQPSGDLGAMLPLLLAVAAAGFASRISSFIVGFEPATLLATATSGAMAAHGIAVLVPAALQARRPLIAGVAGLGVLLMAGGLGAYENVPDIRAASWSQIPMSRSLAASFATITDGDVDGISGSMGHPDCDDFIPHVFPGAREVAGNGRDDNCLAGDIAPAEVLPLWEAPHGVRAHVPQEIPFERKRWNVLIITLDAVRADHLSLYGYERPTSPYLEEFAKSALVFEQAWSPSNFTSLSLFSMFTGLYPSAFLEGETIIGTESMTLAGQLYAAGYITEAVVDFHPPLPHVYGGFRYIDDSLGLRAANAVRNRSTGSTARDVTRLARQAVKRLSHLDKPFLLWVHYSEPHAEYLPHPGFEFGDGLVDRYDGEIAYADQAVRLVMNRVIQTERLADTIVVVTSDHGEAFGEHGTFTHGQTLYQEELHVPFLLYLPTADGKGVRHGRVEAPMDLTDLTPTLLDALGIAPKHPMHGESLLPHVLTGTPLRTPEAFAETRLPHARLQALRRGNDKIILDHLIGTSMRFDLAADPFERSPTPATPEAVQEVGKWTDLHLSLPDLR